MTKEEALHKLRFMRDAYQKLIDENVDEGRFVGTDVTGTWKADTPLNEVYKEHVDALNLAIISIDKQIPRKAVGNHYAHMRCPACNHRIPSGGGSSSRRRDNWCNYCGQKIDWERDT